MRAETLRKGAKMKVEALISFTTDDLAISMRVGEVAEIADELATELIADGYVEEYSEGVGSSDCSIAHVTITSNYDTEVDLSGAYALEDENGTGSFFLYTVPPEEETSVDVILYKGSAYLQLLDFSLVITVTSGDAEVLSGGNNLMNVRSDCAITISEA